MSKLTSYAKEIKALLTGNEADMIAAQNERKALSAVNGNIAAIEAKLVDQEESVRDAEESLKLSKYPKVKITDNAAYIQGIRNAQKCLTNAQDTLEDTKKSLQYWKDLKEDYTRVVEG